MVNRYVALDLETTGLNPVTSEILEIGAVKVENGEVIDSYQTFVRCNHPISYQITELTGITQEMERTGIALNQALDEIFEFCEDLCLLGHNIQFDFSFLKTKAVQQKKNFKSMGIDTLKIARKVLPNLEKRNLEYLSTYYKIPVDVSHRALDDAITAMKLYQIFEREYAERKELFEPVELVCRIKKDSPITPAQKGYLNDLLKYHKIDLDMNINELTKSEASRMIDQIIRDHGRIQRFR